MRKWKVKENVSHEAGPEPAAVGRYEPNPAVWDEPSSHRDEERRGAFKDVQQWQEGKHHSSWGTSPGLRTAQTFPGI